MHDDGAMIIEIKPMTVKNHGLGLGRRVLDFV